MSPSSPATEAETLKRRAIGAAKGGGLLAPCQNKELYKMVVLVFLCDLNL